LDRPAGRFAALSQGAEAYGCGFLADRQEEAYQKWLQDLRGKATIEMNWSLL
jgi:hypothetical protein